MSNNMYWDTILTGGGEGSLDSIDGAIIEDKDGATTVDKTTEKSYFHVLDATSGAAENPPEVVKPVTNAGLKRWIRVNPDGLIDGGVF